MYTFEEVEIDISKFFAHAKMIIVCNGEVDYEYEPGEPDEPWGHWGATPGCAAQADGIVVTSIDEATWEDENGKLHDLVKKIGNANSEAQEHVYKEMLKWVEESIVTYFEDNNEILTQDYEESHNEY